MGLEPRLLVPPVGPFPQHWAASWKALEASPQGGLCALRMEQCPGHWRFRRHQENQKRTQHTDPAWPEPQPGRLQGAPGGQIKAGAPGALCSCCLRPAG